MGQISQLQHKNPCWTCFPRTTESKSYLNSIGTILHSVYLNPIGSEQMNVQIPVKRPRKRPYTIRQAAFRLQPFCRQAYYANTRPGSKHSSNYSKFSNTNYLWLSKSNYAGIFRATPQHQRMALFTKHQAAFRPANL